MCESVDLGFTLTKAGKFSINSGAVVFGHFFPPLSKPAVGAWFQETAEHHPTTPGYLPELIEKFRKQQRIEL